ncbi:MAG: DUF3300 domain-containing protein [Hyphomicrobiaceae bacterium]
MHTKPVLGILLALLAAVSLARVPAAVAQDAQTVAQPATFKTEQLDQMLAPIALFPDELVANILMASTYPLDVVQAARWRKEPANAKLKGDALTKALDGKNWDPSVKALTMFPDVLNMMSEKLEWTQTLGDAFLAQQGDVFARIQFLRQKAEQAGNLKTNKQQKVKKQADPKTQTEYIVIEAAQPDIVYVPVYQPTVVYGSWWYPAYPPYYWNWYPGATFVRGFFWGAGFAIANNIWGWNRCDWNHRKIDIDVNRYNKINVNRAKISSNTWQHNPQHRGPVPYRDKATREKYGKDRGLRDKKEDFSGFDKNRGKVGGVDQVKRDLKQSADGKLKDKSAGADRAKDKLGDRERSGAKGKARDRDTSKAKTASGKANSHSKQVRTNSSRPSKSAMDVKPRAQVTKHVNRGHASRSSAVSHQRGGGGGGRGGGGRGRR